MTSHPCCVERDILNFLAFSDQSQREPLLVLDAVLRIITANLAFYQKFSVTPKETQEGTFMNWVMDNGIYPN